MFGVKDWIKLNVAKAKWRRRNYGNGVFLDGHAVGFDNISVGDWSYGPLRIVTSSPNPSLRIGSFCSIAEGVTFVTCDGHPLDYFSSFPFRVRMLGESVPEATDKGGIIVEDDVWIGYGATVLDGVKIGRGGSSPRGRSSRKMWSPIRLSAACPPGPSRRDSAGMSSTDCSSSITRRWTKASWRRISNSSTARWTQALSGCC